MESAKVLSALPHFHQFHFIPSYGPFHFYIGTVNVLFVTVSWQEWYLTQIYFFGGGRAAFLARADGLREEISGVLEKKKELRQWAVEQGDKSALRP